MAGVASLEGLAVGAGEEALGFGLGFALAHALGPLATTIAQEAYSHDPSRAVEPGVAAAIVAEDVEQQPWGESEAAAHGINGPRFDAIVRELLDAPGIAELLAMLRRGTINPDDFLHGLRKGKLETRWDGPLADLQHERLDPSVVATAIQRGIIRDPGLLPVEPPGEGGRVPPMPRADVDALDEAKARGYDRERLATITRIVGLPPGPGELMQLLNRRSITETDFLRGIAEGNTRNEWGSFLMGLRRRILTPHEYAELHLRGWIEEAPMHTGAELSGMENDDTDLLFKLLGRPIPVHQVTTGLARGGHYNGDHSDIPQAFIRSLQQGNTRPEWYDLAYHNRYTYPSAFVLRALVQSGDLTESEGHEILLFEGWEPDLAAKVARRWAEGTGSKGDPHVGKAETHLWTALHRSYVIEETEAEQARGALTALGVAVEAQPRVLELWDRERELVRRTLTPSQIKKAFHETRFTREDALARLERLGMNAADAATLLDE